MAAHPGVRRGARRRGAAALLLLFLPAAGCGRAAAPVPRPPAAARGEISVATWNLRRYALDDRDGDGQANDPKPEAERAAVAAVLARVSPDVLAVQEIGNPAVLQEFLYRLREAGLDYPHVEYPGTGVPESRQALLSRLPVVGRRAHADDAYTIGERRVRVLRAFIDVDLETPGGYRFRVLAVHLKSKTFHPLGQTEMRRSEARLLARHVRRALADDPEARLVVLGDFNDAPDSAPLRALLEGEPPPLRDPRPADPFGDVWTYFFDGPDTYARIDYLLVSARMAEDLVAEKTRVVRDPLAAVASDHRPLAAVFRAENGARP